MKIILLSAGAASRLGDITRDTPKCLLPLANGETVLDVQMNNIIAAGITDVVISAGFKVEMIENHVKRYMDRCTIKVVHNPFYDVSNNLVSLWNVRYEFGNDGVFVINGDNLFEKSVLELALSSSESSCLLVNKKEQYDEDDMKVILKAGHIKEISKKIQAEKADAESIGMMQFNQQVSQRLVTKLEDMVRHRENLGVYYLTAIQQVIDDGEKICAIDIDGKAWAEIDYPEDYAEAIKTYREFSVDYS